MRVISGSAKGRPLKAVPGMGTRPTTDKVKEAIFSMIGPYFHGGIVLDLYAGTGGLGIEALSRGMDKAVFVDADKKSIEVVHANLQAARLEEKAEVYRNDALRALKALGKREARFHLVFLDPPYKVTAIVQLIQTMLEQEMLESAATIVVEHDSANVFDDQIGDAVRIKHTEYGETAVSIYRRTRN
ncbi:16S rRNA (guanine(966)-N(2))-methyltransferase RsmD [Paenibacillus hemerocallicola]|uniref:16S rRNA (Guanine(966)-N(2))-methyltransferase RsmD n=1 Tax=Paenibacillus hemerocallicola TaxID=1172614 RepID=A0A5C4T595_9BACL|nr:16S rRNA (guanine(966)-N(2))-methyltransferase RsmD [Paenibacillus hemerocallicola]TNJ64242.1 16S rRNA (guanine(966)-N(2))-methyltransferase RsmD [Paenibacillus hemerocallicola]